MIKRRNVLIGGGALAIAGAGAVAYTLRQMGSTDSYNAAMLVLRRPLPHEPSADDLIRFATLAANSHNTQAWRFRASDKRIDILPDLARSTPAVDPDNHHLFVSLGCAVENLSVAAASRGVPGEASFDALANEISFAYSNGAATDTALSDAIPKRQSTRGLYDGSQLPLAELNMLADAAKTSGVDLVLITDGPKIHRIADLVIAGNTAQMADPGFVSELKHWLRCNPRSAMESGDGLFGANTGNPSGPAWLGSRMFNFAFKAKTENEKYARQIASSAGIAVFASAKADPEHWVLAGRACQRFSLQATAMGLKHAYLNQPVEVANLRDDLANVIGLPGRRPDIVMRFGRDAAMPFSPRRPVGEVMV